MGNSECAKFQCCLRSQCDADCTQCNKRYVCTNCVHTSECDIVRQILDNPMKAGMQVVS